MIKVKQQMWRKKITNVEIYKKNVHPHSCTAGACCLEAKCMTKILTYSMSMSQV